MKLILYIFISFVLTANAQVAQYETEPNNKPLDATKISPPIKLIGQLPKDDQDLYLWDVSDAQSALLWDIELNGMSEALTKIDIMRIVFAEDGKAVTRVDKIYSLSTRDGNRPKAVKNLLFSPGKYYLGLSFARAGKIQSSVLSNDALQGLDDNIINDIKADTLVNGKAVQENPANSYRISLKKGAKIYFSDVKKGVDKTNALKFNTYRKTFLYQQKPLWAKFSISEKETKQKWQIAGEVSLGTQVNIQLFDNNNQLLTQANSLKNGAYELTDLVLPKGDYYLKFSSKQSFLAINFFKQSIGVLITGEEAEPNDKYVQANKTKIGETVSGRMSKTNEYDYFSFEINEEMSKQNLSMVLTNSDKLELQLCLLRSTGKYFKCKKSKDDIRIENINLPAGRYGYYIRGKKDAHYLLNISPKGIHKSIMEAEPNDFIMDAVAMNAKNIIRGNFNGDEYDYYKFEVTQDKLSWSIQANGGDLIKLTLYNAAGIKLQSTRPVRAVKRIKLSHLNLSPGRHTIGLKGFKGKYLLRAFSTGEIDENYESEPNNSIDEAIMLGYDKVRKGNLNKNSGKDYYLFKLDNDENIRLSITPPDDGDVKYYIYHDGKSIANMISHKGETITFAGEYPTGLYHVSLEANKYPTNSNYQIKLERLPKSKCISDCEPNNSLKTAQKIPDNWKLKGTVGTQNDSDWYTIAPLAQESEISFEKISGEGVAITAINEKGKQYSSLKKISVPVGERTYIKVKGRMAKYEYNVLIDGKKSTIKSTDGILKGIAINIKGLPQNIKAFYDYGQNLQGTIELLNNTNQVQQLSVALKASHYAWKIKAKQNKVELAAGARSVIPFTIKVPNDVFSDSTYFIDAIVTDASGNLSQKGIKIIAKSNTRAANPSLYWAIDEAFLGGINIASYAMGAKRTAQDIAKNKPLGTGFDKLFDNSAVKNAGLIYRGGRKNENDTITIDLAGETEQEVIGFIINPLSGRTSQFYPKNIEFQLSLDGLTFTTVLKTQVKTYGQEQSFVLPQSMKAQYARLILVDSYSGVNKEQLALGEWKVISKATALGKAFNIAAPKHGGYVVWAIPQLSRNWETELLTEKQEKINARSTNSEDWQWVIGFQQQRAALIDKVQWVPPALTATQKSFDKVQIMASTNGPVGPWHEVTTVSIDNTKPINEMVFEQPIWARYLKFNVGNVEKRAYRYPPKTIRVIEHAASADYKSILGEWGNQSNQSYFEISHPIDFIQKFDDDNYANHSKAKAIELQNGQLVSGHVQLEEDDKPDWYKVKVASGQNTLVISLKGEPNVRTVIQCEDEQGTTTPLTKTNQTEKQILYSAPVEAGKYYYLKINEPPRSVIFAWDSSGSTSNYHPIIYHALNTYSQGVIPGRDLVNFLPFGGKLLMHEWYDAPITLKTILNEYQRKDDSSSAETTLANAIRALENRQGSKAIIVLTDAITPKDINVWHMFNKSQPRVFSLGILQGNAFGSDVDWQEDLLQSWSMVNHGDFHVINNAYDVGVAYERVSAKLRQPANYVLKVESKFEKAKGPGTLKIIQDKSNQSGAIELILDASGSMLKRLNGKRRINIAKEVLSKAVTEIIPQGTPVALRVFGNKQAGSCRTDLAMPLKPLNAQKAHKIIQSINAKNLAKTPIAASLAKVASDLKANKGKKIVILVTDGEETCDGKPEEAIKSLIDAGIDIRLNIVGFAIDDKDLKQQFQQWSSQGGGKYFDSNNSKSLKSSVTQALQTPYSVFLLSGELVAEGTIEGEPIELPAGFYNIKVFASETKLYEKYQIKGEQEQIIKLE